MTSAVLRFTGPTILVLAAIIATLIGLLVGGGADPRLVSDPGEVVRWGLPLAKLLVNLSGAVMVGTFVLVLYSFTADTKPFNVSLNVASTGAAVLTVASGTVAFLTFLSSFNPKVSLGLEFGSQFGRFLMETDLGRAWLITTILASVVTLLSFAARSYLAVLLTGILAVVNLVPMATQGHSGDLGNHDAAVMSLVLHVIFAAVWLGGLLLLVIVRTTITSGTLEHLLRRYSSLALIAFIGVSVSGYARALTAIGRWEDWATPYGVLLVAKIAALLILGAVGALHRRRLIPKASRGGGAFWGFVLTELVIMGIASGAAAALARTRTAADTTNISRNTAAEILNRADVPPQLSWERWFSAWNLDVLWIIVCGLGLVFYVAGVRRMRQRGQGWPTHRTVMWVTGMALLFWATSGPTAVYGDYLLSMRLLSLSVVSVVVPLLIVSAAPLSLAVGAIRARNDGSRGGREWLSWAAGAPLVQLVLHPMVAAGIFLGSLWTVYYTDLFRWSLSDLLGHEWLIAHFLLVGCLLVTALTRTEHSMPGLSFRWRLCALVILTLTVGIFWLATTTGSGLMVSDWFGAMGRTWGPTPLQDQRIGGVIALSIWGAFAACLMTLMALRWHKNRRGRAEPTIIDSSLNPHISPIGASRKDTTSDDTESTLAHSRHHSSRSSGIDRSTGPSSLRTR